MSKTTKIIIGIVVVVIIVVLIVVFYKPVPKGTIKIGVLADFSGNYVTAFRGIPRGVELAVEEIESENNICVELIMEDIKSCDAKETVNAMNKLIRINNVDVIIGGTCSNTTLAAAPIAEQTKTIMISPSSSAPTVSEAGEYVFRTYISDVLRAKEIARLAYDLGKRKMAIITDISNDATVEGSRGAKTTFTELGGEITIEEEITKENTDFRTQLARIKNTKPDVVCISITGPNQIGLIAKQARELGLGVQFVTPFETVEDVTVINIARDTIEGLIYVMPGNPPETPKYQELKRRYKEKYGEDEMPSYVTEAYDAIMLGVKAVLASNGTKENIKDKLYEVSKIYQGVSGDVAFDKNGDVTKPVMFKTIKNGQFVPLEDF